MSMIEGCPNNELLELLKTKKHARILFTCWNILKMRITSYTIAYQNLNLWLRSIKEKIESWVRRLIIWKRNVNLTEAWKEKEKFCLKVKNVCLMQAYLYIPHWRCLIHAYGILTVVVLVIWLDKILFKTLKEKVGDYVTFGDGSHAQVLGKGTIEIPGLPLLKDILYIKGLKANLLSIT